MQVWFARVLRDGVCLSVTERFALFKEVGAYHVRALLTAAGTTDGVDTKAAAVLGATSSAAAEHALVILARCNNSKDTALVRELSLAYTAQAPSTK